MRGTISIQSNDCAGLPKLLEKMRSALPGRNLSEILLGLSSQENVKLLGKDGTVLAVIRQRELPEEEFRYLRDCILSQEARANWLSRERREAFEALSRELGVQILFENGSAALYLQGERFTFCLSKDPFAMAGAAPAGQGMVLTEKERERCRRALREELLSAAFVWTGKSGIPVGAEPAGALQEEFRSLADPVLNGVRYAGWTKCSYTLRDRTYLVETQAQSCAVQDGVLLSEKPSETLRNLRRLTSGKRYQACSRYFSDLAGEEEIQVPWAEGAGVLLGNTDLRVECLGHRFRISWACEPFSSSVGSWKKACREQLLAIRKKAEEKERTLQERFREAAAPFAGNFLVEDIAACLLVNEERITERALIQSLRGTKVYLESGVRKSAGAGRYRLLPGEEIARTVEALCRAGFITRKFQSGYYADYYLLKPGEGLRLLLSPSREDPEEALRMLAGGQAVSDRQAQAAFDAIRTRERTDADWVYLIALASCKGFVCRNQELYRKAFTDLSREGRALLRMKKDAGEDPFEQKVLRRILQSTKKERGAPGIRLPDAEGT